MSGCRIAIFLWLGSCALTLSAAGPSAEPTWQHQSLTRWLQRYQEAKPGSPAQVHSRAAIRSLGTNALPPLL